MNNLEILILSVAMALDAFIVSFTYGSIINVKRFQNALVMALFFGLFQFLMPLFGWIFTGTIYSYLEKISKWVVFTVFLFLAFKFLKEAFEKEEENKVCCIGILCILGLAIATSIDAFGAGISIKLLNVDIIFPSVMIGVITFLLSFCGFNIAKFLNNLPSRYVEIAGSVLLFYLAIKSLF